MLPLPIDPVLPELLAISRSRGVVVLEAPPGAGKTTRVPPALLDAMPEGEVIVLEPRRLAARLSAIRVASERGELVGQTVGYDVRFDRAIGPKTRLRYVTEGILARRLLEDRTLRGVAAVVLDEFHERHLQSDLALGLLKRLRENERPDLKLVVMSATLDAAPVAAYLGDAPRITSEGRRFAVSIEYLPRPDDRPLQLQIASAIRDLARSGLDGDVLVFLPGAAEIRRAADACEGVARDHDLLVVTLHGDLSPTQQDAALAPANKRKVILSTNVAETSVTIEGVVAVIDSGLARIAGHDPWTGRSTLDVGKISRSSATQRAGRAGRVREGRAIRLYTKGDHDARPEHDAPEVVRVDLAEAILGLHSSGIDPRTFPWLTPPPPNAVDGAESLLARLGAIEAGKLTATGARMLKFPLAPRLSRMVVEGERRFVAGDACTAAAILAHGRDIYSGGHVEHVDGTSDLAMRIVDLRDRHHVDRGAAAQIERIRAQLARLVDDRKGAEDPDAALRMAILAGFPDRVARRRSSTSGRLGASRDLLLCTGGSAVLAENSVVRTDTFLVAVEAQDRRGVTTVWLASAIEPDWLIDLFPEKIEETVAVTWNAEAERVEATERMLYDKLVIDERSAGKSARSAIARMLVDRALAAGLRTFVGDDLDLLRARIAFLREKMPDAEIPSLDDAALREMLVTACEGRRSFAELRAAGLLDEIRNAVGYEALAKIDRLAPTHVVLGNGRRATVDYVPGQAPALSSRLQDFFGSVETPRLADGRVPVVLHLLAPNGRDVQVTTDLAGFWANHYPSIRKELMRRYPRHAWPEDPKSAAPPEIRRR
ncbi:MAG: ATP-dependent helicase HrpB [Polyangiales bacterium]